MKPIIRATVTFLKRVQDCTDPRVVGLASMPGLSSGLFMPHLVIQSPDVRVAKVIDGNVLVEDYLGVRIICVHGTLDFDQPLACEMELIYHPHVNYDAVREGATFTVREGGRVIGFGVVTGRTG